MYNALAMLPRKRKHRGRRLGGAYNLNDFDSSASNSGTLIKKAKNAAPQSRLEPQGPPQDVVTFASAHTEQFTEAGIVAALGEGLLKFFCDRSSQDQGLGPRPGRLERDLTREIAGGTFSEFSKSSSSSSESSPS